MNALFTVSSLFRKTCLTPFLPMIIFTFGVFTPGALDVQELKLTIWEIILGPPLLSTLQYLVSSNIRDTLLNVPIHFAALAQVRIEKAS